MWSLTRRVIWCGSELRRCRLSHVLSSEFVSKACHFFGHAAVANLMEGSPGEVVDTNWPISFVT